VYAVTGQTVLLTGATGYIGSHTWLCLAAAGYRVVGVDNFANSSPRVLERLHSLMGTRPVFERADVRDAAAMLAIAQRHRVDAAIHFAALKAVGGSMREPLLYYDNNLGGLIATCDVLANIGAKRCVFSSSATVYGQPKALPISEDASLAATNPYGQTKLMAEQILADLRTADGAWRVASLRYFNPVGAHESGLIGEDPRGVPANLMPYVAQVAVGRRPHLQVFGNDYDTHDGTGVRDYIHVMDLAEGHVAAVAHLLDSDTSMTLNLGTGRGVSVLDLVKAYERASGREIPCVVAARRAGDVAACYADPSRARAALGWTARRDLDQMCADSWRWQSTHPEGFGADA
jgi:UDP-glucose 4-epimerase